MNNSLQILDQVKPQVANLSMQDVRVDLLSADALVEVRGMQAVMTPTAKNDLLKATGLDFATIDRIKQTSGEKGANAVVRNAMKSVADKKMLFAFDGPRITRVVDPSQNKAAAGMQPAHVKKMAEMMIEKGMQVYGVTASPDGTNVCIQLCDPRVYDSPLTMPSHKNEAISVGKSIHWDAMGGTSIHDFVKRLICSNGLIRGEDGRAATWLTPNMDAATLYKLLFEDVSTNKINAYFSKIAQLQETPLSVREFQEMYKHIAKFGDDLGVIRDHLGDAPNSNGKFNFSMQYERKGLDLENMTAKQLANAPTPFKWWDGINTMTWLGSHETKTNVSEWEKTKMLQAAGKMINRSNQDASNWIFDVPSFN